MRKHRARCSGRWWRIRRPQLGVVLRDLLQVEREYVVPPRKAVAARIINPVTHLIRSHLFRRDLSLKWKEGFAIAGALMIVTLMVTVLYNDIARVLR